MTVNQDVQRSNPTPHNCAFFTPSASETSHTTNTISQSSATYNSSAKSMNMYD